MSVAVTADHNASSRGWYFALSSASAFASNGPAGALPDAENGRASPTDGRTRDPDATFVHQCVHSWPIERQRSARSAGDGDPELGIGMA